MKFLRGLKLLAATILSVALVGVIAVFALVPREALIDYLPSSLSWLIPEPNEEPVPAAPKEASVVAPDESSGDDGDSLSTQSAPSDESNESVAPEELVESTKPESQEKAVSADKQEPDLEDPQVLEKIVGEATDFNDLKVTKRRGVETAHDKTGPFTGWAKSVWSKNGQLEELGRYEDGVRQGLWVEWQKSGLKRLQGHYKNGRQDGLWTHWKSNGVLSREWTYQDGKKVRLPFRQRLEERRLNLRQMLDQRKRLGNERFPGK